MGFEAWFTLATIALCFTAMASNRVAPDIALMGGLSLLLLVGILTPEAAFAGLSNEGVLTVAVLYIVVTGLTETGAIAWLGQMLLGRPRSLTIALTRLMLPVAAMSALLNNVHPSGIRLGQAKPTVRIQTYDALKLCCDRRGNVHINRHQHQPRC